MSKVSAIMYSIANIFNWIALIMAIIGIVFSILGGVNVIPEAAQAGLGWGTLIYFIVMLISAMIIIWMVRRAKAKGTSKLWDVLFIILGALSSNIFYILGGIFGLIARK